MNVNVFRGSRAAEKYQRNFKADFSYWEGTGGSEECQGGCEDLRVVDLVQAMVNHHRGNDEPQDQRRKGGRVKKRKQSSLPASAFGIP